LPYIYNIIIVPVIVPTLKNAFTPLFFCLLITIPEKEKTEIQKVRQKSFSININLYTGIHVLEIKSPLNKLLQP